MLTAGDDNRRAEMVDRVVVLVDRAEDVRALLRGECGQSVDVIGVLVPPSEYLQARSDCATHVRCGTHPDEFLPGSFERYVEWRGAVVASRQRLRRLHFDQLDPARVKLDASSAAAASAGAA